MEIFNAIFILLFFSTFSIKKNENIYNKETFDTLKGIAIIGVFVGHCNKEFLGIFLYKFLCSIGLFSVSLFFFISGYGLMYGYNKKNNFKDTFISKRIIPILINYLIVVIIYYFINNYNITIQNILLCSYIPFSWYILSILCLYIMFYASIIITKKNYNVILFVSLFLISFISVTYCFDKSLPYPYLGGWQMISFIIGMITYESSKIKLLLKKNIVIIGLVFIFFLLWSYMLCYKYINYHLLSFNVCEYIVSYIFPLTVISGLKYLKVNRLLSFWNFFQRYSLQIYLLHGMILFYFIDLKLKIPSELMIFVIFLITILLSVCLKKIVTCLISQRKTHHQ